ncbi:hypothetical protein F4780DRAFT_637660 [Xylariomycetidae sp. FL0641]|nr:hypothetical protein F4780DRAFT_637660 [Xylariomycetidae sp. FL0641]
MAEVLAIAGGLSAFFQIASTLAKTVKGLRLSVKMIRYAPKEIESFVSEATIFKGLLLRFYYAAEASCGKDEKLKAQREKQIRPILKQCRVVLKEAAYLKERFEFATEGVVDLPLILAMRWWIVKPDVDDIRLGLQQAIHVLNLNTSLFLWEDQTRTDSNSQQIELLREQLENEVWMVRQARKALEQHRVKHEGVISRPATEMASPDISQSTRDIEKSVVRAVRQYDRKHRSSTKAHSETLSSECNSESAHTDHEPAAPAVNDRATTDHRDTTFWSSPSGKSDASNTFMRLNLPKLSNEGDTDGLYKSQMSSKPMKPPDGSSESIGTRQPARGDLNLPKGLPEDIKSTRPEEGFRVPPQEPPESMRSQGLRKSLLDLLYTRKPLDTVEDLREAYENLWEIIVPAMVDLVDPLPRGTSSRTSSNRRNRADANRSINVPFPGRPGVRKTGMSPAMNTPGIWNPTLSGPEIVFGESDLTEDLMSPPAWAEDSNSYTSHTTIDTHSNASEPWFRGYRPPTVESVDDREMSHIERVIRSDLDALVAKCATEDRRAQTSTAASSDDDGPSPYQPMAPFGGPGGRRRPRRPRPQSPIW